MYTGPCSGLLTWFGSGASYSLGYSYSPNQHGVLSDWVMDLVSVGFHMEAAGAGDQVRWWCAWGGGEEEDPYVRVGGGGHSFPAVFRIRGNGKRKTAIRCVVGAAGGWRGWVGGWAGGVLV